MTVSTIGNGTHIPKWDMYDRMAKALKDAGISIAQAAEYFDVHRNTVSGWLHERIKPDTRTLRLWSVMTNVPYEWLINGETPPNPEGPDGGLLLPRMDSNHQPPDSLHPRPRPYISYAEAA